jgi:hypothetical protein
VASHELEDALIYVLLRVSTLKTLDAASTNLASSFLNILSYSSSTSMRTLAIGINDRNLSGLSYVVNFTSLQDLTLLFCIDRRMIAADEPAWNLSSLKSLKFEASGSEVLGLSVIAFFSRCSFPALEAFDCDIQHDVSDLIQFLKSHQGIRRLKLYLEPDYYERVMPWVNAENLGICPISPLSIAYFPGSVTCLTLDCWVHSQENVFPTNVWDTLDALYDIGETRIRFINVLTHSYPGSKFTWSMSDQPHEMLTLAESTCINGMLRYSTMFRNRGIKITDQDHLTLEDYLAKSAASSSR